MSQDRIGWVTAITPVVLAILGGIGWLIQHLITSKTPPSVDITQGQTIPVTVLADYIDEALDECREELAELRAYARVYRDGLIRVGLDPDAELRKAGVIPTKSDEEKETADE